MKNAVELLRQTIMMLKCLNYKFFIKYMRVLLNNMPEVLETRSLGIIDNKIIESPELISLKYQKQKFVLSSNTISLVREIIIRNCYGFDMAKRYGITVDLGANAGVFSVLAAKVSNKVISVECNDKMLDKYEDTMKLNDVQNTIFVNKFVSNVAEGNKITLDDLIKSYSLNEIGFLKMDIEGAEKELFDGDLGWLNITKEISMEIHPCFGVDELNIALILKKNGFRVLLLDKSLRKVNNLKNRDMGYIRARKTQYLFVNTHYLPDYQYGGIVESGSKLFKYLSKLGDFRVVCVSKNSDKVRQFITSNDKCYKSVFFHRFAVSKDAIMGLFRDIKSCDVALINGIFTFPVTLAQFYAMVLNRPFIAATRGGLEPWRMAYKKWKKYFYIKLITIPLLKKARYVHVTSKTEATNIRKLGFNNTILITNGIDIDDYRVLPAKYEFRDKFESRFIFLFMSRISREKGIDILISAYRKFCMSIDRSKHLLVLAGPDETQYLGKFITDYEKENIKRYNGVYEKEKIRLIRRADIVILPSYSENFGNIIAEALVCERSVITTTGTPWDEIEKVGCGYYIKPDTEELYKVMKNAYEKDRNELENMGKKGRRYILSNFSWEVKAKELFVYLKELAS